MTHDEVKFIDALMVMEVFPTALWLFAIGVPVLPDHLASQFLVITLWKLRVDEYRRVRLLRHPPMLPFFALDVISSAFVALVTPNIANNRCFAAANTIAVVKTCLAVLGTM